MVGENNVIKLDMSEYAESHTISKIIGAPPGYIGYDDNKNILEEIRNKPYSVIILDEIEKAHQSVINLFLQVLDEAKIKDASGKIIRFDNILIIMTTNIGFNRNIVGFNNTNDNKILSKLKQHLSSEFINRIYNFTFFNKLNKKHLTKIIEKNINKMKQKFNNVNITINRGVINEIIELSNYKEFGARKVEKIIQDIIGKHYSSMLTELDEIINVDNVELSIFLSSNEFGKEFECGINTK